jgi:hypothetical protein
MTREEWIEKEVAEKENAHNKRTLRAMLGKEHDYWEAEAVRVDNHTGRDDQ